MFYSFLILTRIVLSHRQLFGNEKGRGFTEKVKKDGASSEPAEMTMLERMQAQMVARMAEKSKAADASPGPSGNHIHAQSSEQRQTPSPSRSSDIENAYNSHPVRAPSHRHDTTSPRALSELYNFSPVTYATPLRHTMSLHTSSRRDGVVHWQARSSDTPSPVTSHGPALQPGSPSPVIPRRLVPCFRSSAVIAKDIEEELTRIPVKRGGNGTKGKTRKRVLDEDSAPAVSDRGSDEELTPIPVKKRGKSTKGKGKKRTADELEVDGEGAEDHDGGHTVTGRKSKHQRTGK